MMKTKDCAVATSLILQGFIRSNTDDEETKIKAVEDSVLSQAIGAVRQECDDWAENLQGDDDNALNPRDITVELLTVGKGMKGAGAHAPVSRTPYNLVSAAIALMQEAKDLVGPDDAMHDLWRRIPEELREQIIMRPKPLHEILGADENVGSHTATPKGTVAGHNA